MVPLRCQLGLNGLNFFSAAMQTAFGPFFTVYLTQQNWSHKPKLLDESDNIACMILVPIRVKRLARIPVASGVRHHYVVFPFEGAGQRNPAGSACGESME